MPIMINSEKEMLNRFYNRKVTENDVQEAADALAVSCGTPVVSCNINIVRAVMTCADNYVIAKGTGIGSRRFAKALEDVVKQCAEIAKRYNLFGADNVLLHIETSSEKPLLMEELAELSAFSKKFETDVYPIIGVAVDDENVEGDAVVVRLLATNLKRV